MADPPASLICKADRPIFLTRLAGDTLLIFALRSVNKTQIQLTPRAGRVAAQAIDKGDQDVNQ